MHSQLTIHCDGGSRGNPGPAAIGVVLIVNNIIIEAYKETIGSATNNVAEYSALIKAFELAKKHAAKQVAIVMDSELVIRQMSGKYKVKAEGLLALHAKAQRLAAAFDKVSYKSVPRTHHHQQAADLLVNEALDGI